MTGKEWYKVVEEFFFDGHKQAQEEYVLEIDGTDYEYYVPDYFDPEWTDFGVMMEIDNEDNTFTAEEVFEMALDCHIDIPVEILKYLEQGAK